MPTLYDNFNRVKDFINENNSSYVSKAELASASYASITYLYDNGLKFYPDSIEIDKEIDFEQDAYFHAGTTYISDLYIGEDSINTVFPTYTYVENNFVNSRTDIPVTYIGYSFLKNHNSSDGSELFINGILANGIDIVNDISNPSNTLISLNDEGLYVNSGQLYCNDYTCLGTQIDLEGTTYTHDIIPSSNNSYTLGDSSHLYSATYTTNIYTPNIFDPANSNNSIKFQNGSIRLAYNDIGFYLDNNGFRPGTNGNKLLGTSSNLWGTTYTSQVNVGNNSKMYNDAGGITFSINSNNGIRIGSSAIYPKTSGSFNNGSSSNKWKSTYTSNLYADRSYIGDINVFYNTPGGGMILQRNGTDVCAFLGGGNIGISPSSNKSASLGNPLQYWNKIYAYTAYISNYNNLIWTGTSAEYAALDNYTSYQIYMIKEA